MSKVKKHSSLLAKYSIMYEKKPNSRVFAPLAETYRKIGMIDDSLRILKEGIKLHPTYTMGYIVLANCYYDLQKYELAYSTIRPFVSSNLENITLQKLFAQTCLNLGHLEEALQTFKFLLLLNPKDDFVADQVRILEDDLLITEDQSNNGEDTSYDQHLDEDEWVEVTFSENAKKLDEVELDDKWSVQKINDPLNTFKNQIENNTISVTEHKLDDNFFYEEYDNESSDVINPEEDNVVAITEEKPIITHTLVDLYCEQGHLDKAIEILENILDIHPNDRPTKIKLESLRGELSSVPKEIKKNKNLEKLELTFNTFHSLLVEKSNTIRT